MKSQLSQLKLARVCLQLQSPLAIGSGLYDALEAQPLVLDANGLPVIPGTTLAGVLRSMMPEARQNDLFGAAAHVDAPELGASALSISFAHIHDANNCVQDGQVGRDTLLQDAILSPLLASAKPLRDQVRLNQYGTVDGKGKFERSIVPAGHRFSFEIALWHAASDAEQAQADWQALQQALLHPALTLGGGGRVGLGKIALVSWHEASFDMRVPTSAAQFAALPTRLDQAAPFLQEQHLQPPAMPDWEVWQLDLHFSDYWRIGRGSEAIFVTGEEEADLLPLTQAVVQWPQDGQTQGQNQGQTQPAKLVRQLYLPASSIKGALRHRTEYYLRCLQLEQGVADDMLQAQMASLFGRIAGEETPGNIGRMLLQDVFLPLPECTQTIMHNSIDHFTQGTRDGALFAEEMLYRQHWQCQMLLQHGIHPTARTALDLALNDLCQQRLAFGAASARGHGYLHGKILQAGGQHV